MPAMRGPAGRSLFGGAFVASLLFGLLVLVQGALAQGSGFEPLTIVTRSGPKQFQVEVARNDADRAQGLMYRRSLAPDHGMLFDFERAKTVTMWMKNTYLSLDMIFIRPDGRIARIAERTEPLSERVISSGSPVSAVLEVPAGTADRLGIKAGDRVEASLFPAK